MSNPEASSGGLGAESVEELRENIKAFFQAQGRAVTKEDYIIRTYALPSDRQAKNFYESNSITANLLIMERKRAHNRYRP